MTPKQPPPASDGWVDLRALLVPSDGSRRLGNHRARFNDSRDRGSKIVFFDPFKGDNDTADVYWWDGQRVVDLAGRTANPANGKAYGTNPLAPDEDAIRPFRHGVGMVRNADADPRLRTNDRDCDAVAGGYPDWLLYRRGRTHDPFDSGLAGGRSEAEPMVLKSGLKTFMAVATNMRRGGAQAVPTTGKPLWNGDYAWDERLTGRAVANWIREGFGLPRCNAGKD